MGRNGAWGERGPGPIREGSDPQMRIGIQIVFGVSPVGAHGKLVWVTRKNDLHRHADGKTGPPEGRLWDRDRVPIKVKRGGPPKVGRVVMGSRTVAA